MGELLLLITLNKEGGGEKKKSGLTQEKSLEATGGETQWGQRLDVA